MLQKKALLGLHDLDSLELFCEALEFNGYQVRKTSSIKEMLEAMNIDVGCVASFNTRSYSSNLYQLYVMDANLGTKGGHDYSSANQIYMFVKPFLDNGEARFMAVSNNESLVGNVNKLKLFPCMLNINFVDFFNNL